jgi:integrase
MTGEPSIADVMRAYAEDAVDLAEKNFRKQLDFSPESLKTVEAILQQLHATIPTNFFQRLFRKPPSEKQVLTMAKIFGGYVGETIRKTHGGNWELFDMNGADTVSLRVGEANIFPVAKVYKRIRQGSEENVYAYYQVLANGFAKKEV